MVAFEKASHQARALYVDLQYPYEKIQYLKYRGNEGLAYKPNISIKNNKAFISIGHDPKLEAEQVKNLRLEEGREKLVYDEIK